MAFERIKWIDEVRGLAVILVILGHVIWGISTGVMLRTLIYSFHMPLMFMVSGLVASQIKCCEIRGFVKKTVRLIITFYMPYLIWGYLFWATKYFIYAGNEDAV